MGSLDTLPATTYSPPSPVQVCRRRRSLNTIMEDDEEPTRGSAIDVRRGRDRSPRDLPPKLQVADWLSPLSEHFPTPRGNHFMSAPIPPTSECSEDESVSPTASSAPWTRDSYTTEATDFDDLYDVSSDEDERRKNTIRRNNSVRKAKRSSEASAGSRATRNALPALVIPSGGDPWPGVAAFKLMTSPSSVPPTPPPKVPMSPALFSYLQSQEVPSCSAPPSLDGSLSSEQMAAMSAPPTPNIGNDEDDGDHWGGGVQLQPAAMATLQALSGGDDLFEQQTEQVIELTHISPEASPFHEMQQRLPPITTNIRRNNSVVLSPEQQRCMGSLTRLEIPSPGGFFSALSPGARHTWHLVACTPESDRCPSSTTAEHFYKTPWSNEPVERMVEIPEMSETLSDGLPTARPTLSQLNPGMITRPELRHENSDDTITGLKSPQLFEGENIIPDEILTDYTSEYVEKLNDGAVVNLDRTSMWLAAQSSYLAELINPTEDRDDEIALLQRAASVRSQKEVVEAESAPRKTVRFSEAVTVSGDIACPIPPFGHEESAYYRAFKAFNVRSRYQDTFVHRIPRFEALQSLRVNFSDAHRAQLLSKYQLSVVPLSAKRRMSANVARGDEITPEDPEKLKRNREYEALQQMAPATWNVMASKLLNGGRLIAAPVAKRLARLSSMGPKVNGTPRDRARILDLGGQATCDWAWHVALEYPNTKVYTVTTKALRQLSNSNIRGPKNHRQVAVDRLVKLPFGDNQFDLISAREIYTVLREQAPNGQDEWEACLKECMRVLKPGGYLEFSIMDSDIVNAGPLGLAKSVEFGFNLKTLGYDPCPTKLWLGRLRDAGFVNTKRAWVFLPMGAKIEEKIVNRDSMGVEVKLELEAMVSGSTENAASICGLVGGWAWEKWLLRCQVQTVGSEGKLEGVQDIIEEGRARGAGWRNVIGWARKPLGRN